MPYYTISYHTVLHYIIAGRLAAQHGEAQARSQDAERGPVIIIDMIVTITIANSNSNSIINILFVLLLLLLMITLLL